MALDMSVPGSNNCGDWLGAKRDQWLNRCRNAGGVDFAW